MAGKRDDDRKSTSRSDVIDISFFQEVPGMTPGLRWFKIRCDADQEFLFIALHWSGCWSWNLTKDLSVSKKRNGFRHGSCGSVRDDPNENARLPVDRGLRHILSKVCDPTGQGV